MGNKSFVFLLLMVVALFFGASSIVSVFHQEYLLALVFLILTAAFAAASYNSVVVGVAMRRGVVGMGRLLHQGGTAFLHQPSLWLGIFFLITAFISLIAGVTGMWATWIAFHIAVIFMIISSGCFIHSYQKWSIGYEFVTKHINAIWLSISVLGFLVTPVHQNWSTGTLLIGFFLSAAAALITILGKWSETRTFLMVWLFTKGTTSLFIWLVISVGGLFAFISPMVFFNKAVTGGMVSAAIFYATGLIVLVVVGLTLLWRKL